MDYLYNIYSCDALFSEKLTKHKTQASFSQ